MQFAIMGAAYSRKVLGQPDPKVGLMSVGSEEAKGNALSKEATSSWSRRRCASRANVEGHDLFEGDVDVVVCDGFTGNVILKTSESVAMPSARG